MSKYVALRNNPPKWSVKENAREVLFETVSCMCDNRHTLRMRKNDEGDFKSSGGGFHLSNWGMKFKPYDVEWAADEGNWVDVVNMINSGTAAIEGIKSR